jgi:hypothetical protein
MPEVGEKPLDPTPGYLSIRQGIRVWWAMAWRAALIAVPLSVLIDYLIYGQPFPVGASFEDQVKHAAIDWPINFAASVWTTRIALKLRYRRFRLHVVLPPVEIPAVPVSNGSPNP